MAELKVGTWRNVECGVMAGKCIRRGHINNMIVFLREASFSFFFFFFFCFVVAQPDVCQQWHVQNHGALSLQWTVGQLGQHDQHDRLEP